MNLNEITRQINHDKSILRLIKQCTELFTIYKMVDSVLVHAYFRYFLTFREIKKPVIIALRGARKY